MVDFTLTTGYDTFIGTDADDTVYGTSSPRLMGTLNSVDQLSGGVGIDTLVLTGGNSFYIDGLATFTGFEVIRYNPDGYGADLFLGSQSLTVIGEGYYGHQVYLGSGAVTCVGIEVVYSTSVSNWNAANSIDGGSIYLNTTSNLGSVYYDFTTNTLSNITMVNGSWGAYYDGSGGYYSANLTVQINSAVASRPIHSD